MIRRSLALDPLVSPSDAVATAGAPPTGQVFAFLDMLRTSALRRRGSLDSVPPGLLWDHARAAARDFQYPPAIADVRALVRVASAREQQGLTEVEPFRLADFRYMLADLYHLAGDRATAATLYREVLTDDIGMFMAHVQLARIAEAEGDTARGLDERRAAADANPEDHTLVLDLGVALHRAGRLEAAETALRQARALNARDPWVHYRLGVLLDVRGKREEAVETLRTFVRIAPAAWTAPLTDARARLDRAP
jgi:tetratricopeptide (TPR) repeat protein